MNDRPARQRSLRRYRRRILGWGAAGVAVVFAVGAPIFVNRVEDDLERRSIEVLDAAQIGPVSAHFSGQDGELRCPDGPVDIPTEVVAEIRDEWGVSSLELAASCTTAAREPDAGESDPDASDSGDPADETATTAPATSPTTVQAPETTVAEPERDAIPDVISSDSQFSTLSGLLDDAGLTRLLAGDGPYTVFAPTNAAFEALGPDVIGELARDPEMLGRVLSHHLTAGTVLSADLTSGEIDMLDETTISVDVSDAGVVLGSGASTATVTEPDLVANNGIVHAIDQVLVPEGMVFGEAAETVIATAEFVDGQITLTGTVATQAQRDLLVAAAEAQVDAANVIDELVVDSSTVIVSGAVDAFGQTISVLPPNLVSGTAELSGSGIVITGIYATDDDRAAAEAALADIDGVAMTVELTERAAASGDDAEALEADLNALVAANPVLFEPNLAEISPESAATIDRVAAVAGRFGDVAIEIRGYTDTDGVAESNQILSEARAAAVVAALVERGLDGATLTSVGFGGTQPILGSDGVEDKAASRRVEFVVVATQ